MRRHGVGHQFRKKGDDLIGELEFFFREGKAHGGGGKALAG
jgi:hypothetical protein